MPAVSHDYQCVRVGQGKILIAKAGEHAARLCQLIFVERSQTDRGQRFNEGQKLRRSVFVIAPEKPAVAFGDHQC